MKKSDQQLISRGLDNELNADERKKLSQKMAVDPEICRIDAAWRKVGDQLRYDSRAIKMPDTQWAWQDIQRAIRQSEHASGESVASGFPWRLTWAGAMATVAVIGLLGWSAWRLTLPSTREIAATEHANGGRVEWVESELPGATTMIYTDTETDITVIWMDVALDVDPRDT